MEILILWLAFAGICAFLAPSRNRDPLTWGMIGALFGVFALVALLAMPPAEEK